MSFQTPEKPTAKALAKGARAFVKDNLYYFKLYIKPLIVPIIVSGVMTDIFPAFIKGQMIQFIYMPILIFCALLQPYLTACFALSWHRAVLLGPKPEHAVSPFKLKPGEAGFILAFFVVGLIPLIISGVPMALTMGAAFVLHRPAIAGIAALPLMVLMIYSFILSMRMLFILPAKSVNASMTWREARQVSRGLVWKLFASAFFWNLLCVLALYACFAVIGVAAVVIYGMPNPSHPFNLSETILMFVLVKLPIIALGMYLTAFNVTILSRLYQWSLQNRPLVVADNKDNRS